MATLSVELVYLLMAFMSSRTIARFSQTCRRVAAISSNFNLHAFQLSKTLSRTFTVEECISLRVIMREAGAILGGITALEFFTREHIGSYPVDLIVWMTESLTITQWLLSNGFVWKGKPFRDDKGDWVFGPQQAVRSLHASLGSVGNQHLFHHGLVNPVGGGVAGFFVFHREGSLPVRLIVTRYDPFQAVLSTTSSKWF